MSSSPPSDADMRSWVGRAQQTGEIAGGMPRAACCRKRARLHRGSASGLRPTPRSWNRPPSRQCRRREGGV
eukprot:7172588-Pyramimonas_sp.AAC.1